VTAHVANNSGNNEWYSPPEILDAARRVLGGFDLDPASSAIANERVKAGTFFSVENNALIQPWPVCRIWMNPPYSQPLIGQFAARFAAEVARGSTGIVLVNNATDTAWFQTLAAACSAICLPRGRIRFIDPEGKYGASPLQGQAILYAGSDTSAFLSEFRSVGLVALCHVERDAPQQEAMDL
jgi:phage N-6-adenine-methyltransferase